MHFISFSILPLKNKAPSLQYEVEITPVVPTTTEAAVSYIFETRATPSVGVVGEQCDVDDTWLFQAIPSAWGVAALRAQLPDC